MDVPLLDLSEQHDAIADELRAALDGVVRSDRFILGPEVEALEREVASYVGAGFGVGVASGTDALLLTLRALGADAGSDVVVPSFTFFATAGAVWNAGLRPVFCDVDPETFNVTARTVEAAWTERTVAVVPVHLFGRMAPMGEVGELARARGAFVLEDCAQSIGASSPDGRAGSTGDAGAFSFFPSKNLGGLGDGGMVCTSDGELAERVARLRAHGGRKMYHHDVVGTNSRLDALQAAVLRVKLRHLDRWTAARRQNACRYAGLLEGIDGVRPPVAAEGHAHVYNQYTVRAERRDALREHLTRRDVGSAIYYPVPLHLQECFAPLGYGKGDLPVTEALCEEVLSLPVAPGLGELRAAWVAGAIREFYG